MSAIYPFKFLDPYTKKDKAFFFGRNEEIEQLYEMVFQTNMIFVYGPSGSGKTSLLQCGLASKFRETDWFELSIRRKENICEATRQAIQNNIIEEEEGDDDFWEEEEEELDFEEKINQTAFTPDQKALIDLYNSIYKPIYIIYDQFEELYTLGTEKEQQEFIHLIQDLERVNVPCTFLFVMREEYLANLYEFERAVPDLLKKKLRVEPMNLDSVGKVVKGITTSKHSLISLKGSAAEKQEIVVTIFNKIREGKRIVQLPYLQIFMDRMYEKITGDTAKKRNIPAAFTLAEANKMQNIEVLLENFLDTQIHAIERELHKKGHQNLPENFVMSLLSPLVTVDGTKEPLNKTVLIGRKEFKNFDKQLLSQTLSLLESSRILRYRDEGDIYEVAHDTLAKKINENRSEEEKAYLKAKRLVSSRYADYKDTNTLLNAQELAYIMPFKDQLLEDINKEQITFIQKSKRAKRRKTIITWSIVASILVAAIIAILVILAAQKEAKREAKKAKEEAEKVQKTLQIVKRNQAISHAKEQGAFGDGYRDLEKYEYACEAYNVGLDSLRSYKVELDSLVEEGYKDASIYNELQKKYDGLCN